MGQRVNCTKDIFESLYMESKGYAATTKQHYMEGWGLKTTAGGRDLEIRLLVMGTYSRLHK